VFKRFYCSIIFLIVIIILFHDFLTTIRFTSMLLSDVWSSRHRGGNSNSYRKPQKTTLDYNIILGRRQLYKYLYFVSYQISVVYWFCYLFSLFEFNFCKLVSETRTPHPTHPPRIHTCPKPHISRIISEIKDHRVKWYEQQARCEWSV